MSRRRSSCAPQDADQPHEDTALPEFLAGRATVHSDAPDELDHGRMGVMDGRSLTSWLVWDWTRQVDERMESLDADVYDLADRVHYLTVTVMVAFLVIVLALSVVIGVVVL